MSKFIARGLAVLCWSPWLLPHNVLPNAKCGFSGQANMAWGPLPKWSPIQYGCPSYIGAYIRTKCTSQNSSLARNRIVAYRGCLKHKPITAWYMYMYLVLPTRPHRDWLGDGVWTLGMGQWDISIFFYIEISAIPTYGNRGVARTLISLRNDLGTAFACRHLRLK